MVNFAKLKANSGKQALEKLSTQLEKLSSKQFTKDETFWLPTVDKAGNGYAVIRFLPAHDDDDDACFVRRFECAFQGPSGSWYIENSLTTFNKPDPVAEYNTRLWNTGLESDKEIARKYKRNLRFISRIYVVTDSGNPDCEGKAFRFKFGKKIFDKLATAMNPEFQDETPMNPFDLWVGANFKLKIRKVEGRRNYDKSEFADCGPLGTDEMMLEVMKQADALPIKQFIAPDQFKTYEQLKERFEQVMGLAPGAKTSTSKPTLEDTEDEPERKAMQTPSTRTSKAIDEEEDEDVTKFFASLDADD